jgi:hypothetical protein
MREHRFTHTLSYQEDRCRRCGEEFDKKSKLLAHLKSCFRQHRTKNGSIDESLFDYPPTAVNGNNFDEAPSGLMLAGIKLENNNEPSMHPFLMNGTNGLHDLGKDTAHIAASISKAIVQAPPEAHAYSQPESAQDLSATAPESPLDLAKSAPQSPIDLIKSASQSPMYLAKSTSPSPIDLAKNAPESPINLANKSPVITPPKLAPSSPKVALEDQALDLAHGSPGSEVSLSNMAANNNAGEKPMDLATAIETPKGKALENGVGSVPILATTILETPKVGMV